MYAFALICSILLLLASCAKKQVQVSPTSPSEASISGQTDQTATTTDLEAVREKRLQDLQSAEKESAAAEEGEEDIFSQKIHFAFDRSDLNEQARDTLKKIAAVLRLNPSYSLDIAGHCDERGTSEYNLALGERRARAAKKFLVNLGISADRITTVSYGEERPIDPGHTEEAWAKNRRDEFTRIK